jgi:hypothetical protein
MGRGHQDRDVLPMGCAQSWWDTQPDKGDFTLSHEREDDAPNDAANENVLGSQR